LVKIYFANTKAGELLRRLALSTESLIPTQNFGENLVKIYFANTKAGEVSHDSVSLAVAENP
jgi:hypothetical protein